MAKACPDVKVSAQTIRLLTGDKDATEIDECLLPIALAIDDPDELPYLIEEIFDMRDYEFIGDVRFGLVRIQIDCDLNMSKDLEFYHRRQYVSQTIENILFGELLIEGVDLSDDEDDKRSEKDGKKDNCKEESKGKKGGKGKGKKAQEDASYQ